MTNTILTKLKVILGKDLVVFSEYGIADMLTDGTNYIVVDKFGKIKTTINRQEFLENHAEEKCDCCLYTDYGSVRINTTPNNLCEGMGCEQAERSFEEDFDFETYLKDSDII